MLKFVVTLSSIIAVCSVLAQNEEDAVQLNVDTLNPEVITTALEEVVMSTSNENEIQDVEAQENIETISADSDSSRELKHHGRDDDFDFFPPFFPPFFPQVNPLPQFQSQSPITIVLEESKLHM